MVSSINSTLASTLFGQSSSSSFGLDPDLLTSIAMAKAGVGVSVADLSADPNAPSAPVWTPGYTPGADALVARAIAGKGFFDTNAKLYSDLGATGDYKSLFALHTGISTLQALAARMQDDTLSKQQKAQTQAEFDRGLAELKQFFSAQQFEDLRLAQGDRVDSAQTTLALPPASSEDYVTGIVQKGSLTGALNGLDPNAKFTITATSSSGTVRNVSIDLSQMGAMTRSLSGVVSFINNKLAAAGALSRLETSDQTPKTTTLKIGSQNIETRYTGAKQYALKVDVRGGEKVAFQPVDADPSFYVLGDTSSGSRLIKLQDVSDAAGQPELLDRPGATADPIGADVATGWLVASAPAGAYEQKSNALESAGVNNFETAMSKAGEAVLKLALADGRTISVSAAWQSADREDWRVLSGQTPERGRLGDLAERLTQLLHEQGVAAGVTMWEDGTNAGLSVLSADGVAVSSLTISGKAVGLTAVDPPNMNIGLREGVFARRMVLADVAANTDRFVGDQTIVVNAGGKATTITIKGGAFGATPTVFLDRLNDQLLENGLSAAASFVDDGSNLSLQIDGLHDLTGVTAKLNGDNYTAALQAPGAWASGGLPVASSGQPFGDALRTQTIAGSPLSTYSGAISLQVVVDTPTGSKTVSVSVSAAERGNDPDIAPGQWSNAFKARLDAALNAAGVYVSASADLTSWTAAEGAGQRIASVTINGDAQSLSGGAPAFGLGGAFSVERSFTSAQAATGVSDNIAALQTDQTFSISFDTVWGQKTVSAALQPGDLATLDSVALRLNEALAAAGYDLGVVATDLSGGGAGLRAVGGSSHTIGASVSLKIGGVSVGTTLDPIDSASAANNPPGAETAAERAARGAAIIESTPSQQTLVPPSTSGSGWFAGRVFDVSIGGGADVATARAVATGADGSVYVLADLDGDSATLPIKGARDVALIKLDSAGNQVYSRILGASQSANGYALAVAADGRVAVAGSVEGDLSGAGVAKGGTDSFVTMYDSAGDQLWTARRGATANDQVNAIAFAPNGALVVAGKTESALGSSLSLGGYDGYVRAYSSAGAELFTKQFGTGRDDTATALLVRSDGGNGIEIFTGGVEDNRGVVRRFTYAANTGLAAGATRDLGFFYKGAINALAADGQSLYVGGEVGAERLTVGGLARAAVSGQEGFVARLDAGLVSTALDRTTYVGSAQDDAVRGLAVVNGQVYAAGQAGGVIAGQGGSSVQSAFVARLADDGDIAWARTFNSAGGLINPLSMSADASGASALDVLGLPRGVVGAHATAALVDRSALRAGDQFQIGADGRRLTTITITADDTLATLAAKISRAIGSAGRAKVVKDDKGAERIEITPASDKAVRIEPGAAGKDALPGLGLGQGVIAVNSDARGALKTFGLGLVNADLKLDSKDAIVKTKAELSAAISIVRQAYDALLHPNAKPQTAEEKALAARRLAAGAAPEYYSAQLANYKAALARLGG